MGCPGRRMSGGMGRRGPIGPRTPEDKEMKRSLGLIDSRGAFYTNSTFKLEVLPLCPPPQSTTANMTLANTSQTLTMAS